MATDRIVESGGLGAAVTPEEWSRFVLDHLSAQAVILASGATEIRTSAKQVHVPRITSDDGAGWYSELEEIDAGAPEGDDLVLTPRKCAKLALISNETVGDSNPNVLNVAGMAMTRGVALEVDRACFVGTGPANNQPTGILTIPGLPSVTGPVDYAGIVGASGLVRAAGGVPTALYVNPTDYTALQLVTGSDDRPLISGDPTAGAPPVIAGLNVWPTPAVPAGQALVAEPAQIVVAVREDASVQVSEHAVFTADGTAARVIARVDVGVNDVKGLALIKAGAAAK